VITNTAYLLQIHLVTTAPTSPPIPVRLSAGSGIGISGGSRSRAAAISNSTIRLLRGRLSVWVDGSNIVSSSDCSSVLVWGHHPLLRLRPFCVSRVVVVLVAVIVVGGHTIS